MKGHNNYQEKWWIFPLLVHNSALRGDILWQNTRYWPKCLWVAFNLKHRGKPDEVISWHFVRDCLCIFIVTRQIPPHASPDVPEAHAWRPHKALVPHRTQSLLKPLCSLNSSAKGANPKALNRFQNATVMISWYIETSRKKHWFLCLSICWTTQLWRQQAELKVC